MRPWRLSLFRLACIAMASVVAWQTGHAESAGPPEVENYVVRFGMFRDTGTGPSDFLEAVTVPSSTRFGVKIVPKDDTRYRFLIVVTAPDHLAKVESGLIVDDSGETSTVATEVVSYRGTATYWFTLDPEDPRGTYRFDVYVGGAMVGSGEITLIDVASEPFRER